MPVRDNRSRNGKGSKGKGRALTLINSNPDIACLSRLVAKNKLYHKPVPIYEYEPLAHDCLMCEGKVAAIQGIQDPPLEYCPDCGLPVRRVVSSASFKVINTALKTSGEKGFTTWKKVESGRWEKVSGPGVDVITGDLNSVKQEDPKKPLDL